MTEAEAAQSALRGVEVLGESTSDRLVRPICRPKAS
jgi:hypothetical protein